MESRSFPHPRSLTAAAAAVIVGCAAVPPVQSPSRDACPITSSTDWAAWVDAMPGPGARPQLIATGKVVAPTGGYTFAWRDLRVMESYPVQIVAELEALPPEEPATQAAVTHDLRGEWPVDPPVGALTITCGERTIARISPVETAH